MFKILDEVCTPKRGTKYSAYVDLFAREDITIGAGETKIVKLGVKLDIDEIFKRFYGTHKSFKDALNDLETNKSKQQPYQLRQDFDFTLKSHYLEVALRSSLGAKGLIIANGIGIIDLDYPDEIGLIVHNPIISIEKEVQFDKDDDYIEIYYWGVSNRKEHSGSKRFKIKKGDKVAQCTLKEHKGYLMGYESDVVRTGGFGSTDNKVEAPIFDKPDFFRCNELN